jgi:hypothetical protein
VAVRIMSIKNSDGTIWNRTFLPGVVRIIEVQMTDGRVVDALLYLVPLSGIEPRFCISPDHKLDTIPTELRRHISKICSEK